MYGDSHIFRKFSSFRKHSVSCIREIKSHVYGRPKAANGKRQIQVENFSELKISG